MDDKYNTTLNVYVPCSNTFTATAIAKKSAIVGTQIEDRIMLDYEGNLYGAANLESWDECLLVAAFRHIDHAPTVARIHANESELKQVGTFNPATRVFTPMPEMKDTLDDWLELAKVNHD